MTTTDTRIVLREGYSTLAEAERAARRCAELGLTGLSVKVRREGVLVDDDGAVRHGPNDPVSYVVRPDHPGKMWSIYCKAMAAAESEYPHHGIFDGPEREQARIDLQTKVVTEALASE